MARPHSGATGKSLQGKTAVRKVKPSDEREPHILANQEKRYFRPEDPDSLEAYPEPTGEETTNTWVVPRNKS